MRTIGWMCVFTWAAVGLRAESADTPSLWTVRGVDFSGLIDGYYSLNFNRPASRVNSLRNFDVTANQLRLNLMKVTAEHAPAPVGFRVDLGYGKTVDVLHGAEEAPRALDYLLQAYISVKPPKAGGLQIDVGKFVTAAGAEVIETNNNWNYSRSLLFAWAIPYYHVGVRASIPVTSYFTAGAQLVNGWNNLEENNGGKTVGLSGTFSGKGVSWVHNYYVGPEKPTFAGEGFRHLYDTTLLVSANERTNFYLNFDYGVDNLKGVGSSKWYGFAGAARVAVNQWFALAPRIEWFNDRDGFSTGTVQKLKEFTMTGEIRMARGLFSRLEYRRDWSNVPFFERELTPGGRKHQETLLAGVFLYLGPRR